MIIPAVPCKIIGFKSSIQGEKYMTPTVGANIMQLQLDNGEIIDIKVFSNDKEFSDSLHDFLESKTLSIIKESEVKQAAFDILYDDSGVMSESLENKIELIANNPENKLSGKKLQQEGAMQLAKELVYNKRRISLRSIIKLPVAIGKGESGEYYNSRSIIIEKNDKNEKAFGRSGIYCFAQTINSIPVEISPIRNKEGVFAGYFKITTAKLINAGQINFIIDHTIRTINEMTKKGKKPFLIQMLNQKLAEQIPNHLRSLFRSVNVIEKLNKDSAELLSVHTYNEYIDKLTQIKQLMKENGSFYKFFKATLPLMYTAEKFKKAIFEIDANAGKSSLQVMPNAITNLNFSKENPNIKNQIKESIQNHIQRISEGVEDFKILSTISFSAPNILGESDTWGFPIDNVAASKFTLSYNDTKKIVLNAQNLLETLKNR